MWSRSYRNHVIMAFPSFDTVTNSWAPQADISWCAGADRQSEFVRFSNRVMSENEAVRFALRRSVAWINQHLRHAPTGAPEKSAKSTSSLHGIQLTPQATISSRPATVLTYDQFKAIVTKLGMRNSEQSLHKSYDALIKLRETRNFSWTEFKDKVRRSQANLKAAKRPRQRLQASLPLTPQAWRRII